jgi:dUTP pyrophosphatase
MKVTFRKEDYEIIPQRSYEGDIGFDLVAISDPEIKGKKTHDGFYSEISYIEYDTGISFAPEDPFFALIYPRSSLSKYNLSLANSVGVIDPGYRATVKVRFKYIVQPQDMTVKTGKVFCLIDEDKIYKKGDKICQLVWATRNQPIYDFQDKLPMSERSIGGFGSSGN